MPLDPRRCPQGYSYVELVVAMAILAICLIPAARVLPGLLAGQRDLEVHYQLSLVAEDKLEDALLALDGDFASRDDEGNLADRGHPEWRFRIRVDVEGAGARATICSQVWVDEDGDSKLDPAEPQVRFDTIAANLNWSP